MAQSSNGGKRPVTTARTPSGAQRSGGSKPAASAAAKKPNQKTGGKNAAPAKKKTNGAAKPRSAAQTPVPETPEARPLRREAGGVLLLFLSLVGIIAYFPVDAWLVAYYRLVLRGVFGWGYYAAAPALFLGGYGLVNHKGRPVAARLVCSLLLPLIFGAFVHALWCVRQDFFVSDLAYAVRELWSSGQLAVSHSGGVLSGMTAVGLRSALSVYGAVSVLLIAFLVALFKALNLSLSELARRASERAKAVYNPEDYAEEDDDFFGEQETMFPVNGGEPIKMEPIRRFRIDIPLDDGEESPTPELPRRKKKTSRPAPFDVEKQDELFEPPVRTPAPARPAEPTKNVKPLSVEEAAAIAGVEVNSAAMDGPTAKKTEKPVIDKAAEAVKIAGEIEAGQTEEKPAYVFPDSALLTPGRPDTKDAREEIDKNRERLESTVRSFGVDAHISGVTHGPTVTRYDLELEQGVKLNKITNLAGDIALALGVVSVRIAPIPDKISTVGVEVPNKNVNTVYLRDIIESANFRKAASKLSFAIGKDIAGNAVVGNISKLPHLLIAGTTGSGKSVCINSLILSLLYKSTPEEVRMIMIDPKMVELGIYNGMPHLFVPVVTDPKKAAGALQWSVVEMLKRYRLFSEAGVRDLTAYNARQRKLGEATVPQVVIIIDELADLMLVASKEVEESICRVAQMGRASGMHLVIATQRPSADVITGLMKANIPSRIAFAVSSAMESRIIMDQSGAEKLIGSGDMLYCPLGIGKPIRVQGAFVSDEEREKVIDFVKQVGEAEYSDEILTEIEKAAADKNAKNAEPAEEPDAKSEYDELLPDAVDVIFEVKQASVSMLQRRLKLGYSRAARLVDQMEALGVLGPYEGSKPRQILITKQQWQEMQYAHGTAPADSITREFADVSQDDAFAAAGDEAEPEGEDAP